MAGHRDFSFTDEVALVVIRRALARRGVPHPLCNDAARGVLDDLTGEGWVLTPPATWAGADEH